MSSHLGQISAGPARLELRSTTAAGLIPVEPLGICTALADLKADTTRPTIMCPLGGDHDFPDSCIGEFLDTAKERHSDTA